MGEIIEETLTELCKRLEHYETPEWAARAILERELMTKLVLDPCCGSGVLAEIAHRVGHQVHAVDIYDWGYAPMAGTADFLTTREFLHGSNGFSVFMNPPFSKAVEFVEHSLALGARKILCFQRFAWWESQTRRGFWDRHPPNRVYICGNRADCWRHDISADGRGSSGPTAHAWFVWERGHPPGTLLNHIWKDDAHAA